jgi:hypothetical protein
MNNNQTGNFMKKTFKFFLTACLVGSLAATLSGCATTTLEQQIAVKEPGSWDFKYNQTGGGVGYIRIYDSLDKTGWTVNEYGQKSPCSQGFIKAIKTTAPGWIAFTTDSKDKSFACDKNFRFIFRTNDQGTPFEGWLQVVTDRSGKDFPDFESSAKKWDEGLLVKKSNASYVLVNN